MSVKRPFLHPSLTSAMLTRRNASLSSIGIHISVDLWCPTLSGSVSDKRHRDFAESLTAQVPDQTTLLKAPPVRRSKKTNEHVYPACGSRTSRKDRNSQRNSATARAVCEFSDDQSRWTARCGSGTRRLLPRRVHSVVPDALGRHRNNLVSQLQGSCMYVHLCMVSRVRSERDRNFC